MKLDEDYKKVINELQKNFGWSNIDILPESYQDLLNDTIMAVKNLTIQRVSVAKHPLPRPLECWNKARELECGDYIEWHLNKERGNAR